MQIFPHEQNTADDLICLFLEKRHVLYYANIGPGNNYLGWVYDFKIRDSSGNPVRLDLRSEPDLFLLFALAVYWSRTGPWENAAYFISWLKTQDSWNIESWKDENKVSQLQARRKEIAGTLKHELEGIDARRKLSIRKDVFRSIHILAQNWHQIKNSLEESEREDDYKIFIDHVRNIEGLGVGKKRMMKKIPLILRELRCQGRYRNIPGQLCCVTDTRVKDAADELGICLKCTADISSVLENSAKIYRLFGELYDIPLFAYEDVKK